ncbi:hypothetical protein Tco_1539951 [Tanacetum coccineum]
MAGDDTPPPNHLSTSADKLIPFSITNKVPIKLDLEKHNYSSWSSFFIIHLGSLGLKFHVEEEASSSTTNLEWHKLDDLIKMWILGSLFLGFSVKDFLTRHILHRCDNSGDLYPVTKQSNIPSAFVSTSSSTWHQRLDHPGDEVLRSLASRHFISCNK